MNKLLFGTAGIPLSTKKSGTVEGIKRVRELGLDCQEMEFVHGVKMGAELAAQVKKTAQDENVVLTAHGPYYINLNSAEKEKQGASITRILDTARVANLCGGYSITFHPAFYQGASSEKVYPVVKDALKTIIKTLNDEGNKIWVRPETTGKPTQFGTVEEILKLSQEIEQIMPCIDFSHLHARTNGKWNTKDEFDTVLSHVEKTLGTDGLQNMHIHISGIAYGEKGEKHHLLLDESDLKYKDLMQAFHDFKIKGVVVCESPNIEGDALLLQKTYGSC
ncbi:TIM barrel protein [Candidatus Woesearchaeota archaeon]|nr:TIM barrel protein [Candidatus Woesearchaeota archaeon]